MKRLLPFLFVLISGSITAQVGIGTEDPNHSSQIDIVASDRGVLIPRVPLMSTTDDSTIANGNVNSLLVFNTATQNDIVPGYYYWYEGAWHRLTIFEDIPEETLTSISIDVEAGTITYVDENNDFTELDVAALVLQNQTLTSIVDNGDGTFTYTDENGDDVTFDANTTSFTDNGDGTYTFVNANGDTMNIDTNADAIAFDDSNSNLGANDVQAALDSLAQIASNGSGVTLIDNDDGTITLESENGVDLGTVTKADLTNNGDGTFTFNNTGNPTDDVVIDVPASIINQFDEIINGGPINVNGNTYNSVEEYFQNLIGSGETLTVLTDNGDGTFIYTDENGDDVTFDANTTSFTDNGDGTYTFVNANGDTMNIDTNADAIAFDNSSNGFTADNVQDALEELSDSLSSGAGVTLNDNNDGSFTLESENGDDLGTINKSNLTDHTDGSYTFSNGDGNDITFDVLSVDVSFNPTNNNYEFKDKDGNVIGSIDMNADNVAYDNSTSGLTSDNVQDAIDEINDALANTSDTLVDNNDGTYTHTAVDGTVVTIDANTTTVTETDGVYTFTDGNGDTITTIDTNADAIAFDNSSNGFTADNVQNALEELSDSLSSGAGVTLNDNNDGSFTLESENGDDLGTINKSNLTDHTDGSYTFSNGDGNDITFDVLSVDVSFNPTNNNYEFKDKDGNVIGSIDMNADNVAYDNSGSNLTADNVQDAIDEINDALANTSDTLVDNNDGTYTHTAVDGTVVTIDANTTTVTETDGVYTFTDGNGDTITTIDTNADAIAFDNSSNGFTADNVQNALEELSDSLSSGAGVTLNDNNDGSFTLESENGDDLGTINKSNLTDHTDGSYTFSNGDGNDITFDVLSVDVSFNPTNNNYEFKDKDGNVIGSIDMNADNVAYDNSGSNLTADNVQDAIDEINDALANTSDTLVDNNDGTYTHTAVDGTVVTIDANTTTVTETDGVYTFTDGNGDTITTIDTNADAIAFDNSSNGFTADNVQDALEELSDSLSSGAGVTLNDNNDGSFTLESENGDDLGTINKSNLTDHTDGSYTFSNGDGNDITFDVLSVDVSFNPTNNNYEFKDKDGNVIGSIDMNADNVAYDNSGSNLTADNVQDAIDEINDALANTSDTLVDNNDGTYTHTAVDGTVVTIDANTASVKEGDAVTIDSTTTGHTTTYTVSADTVGTQNGLHKAADNIKLGGELIEATTLTTDASNTLAIKGLQEGEDGDEIVVADPSSGVLKKVRAVMPKFFYMPSMIMPTDAGQVDNNVIPHIEDYVSESGGTYTVDLHQLYSDQFGLNAVNSLSSDAANSSLPVLNKTDLIYNVTYYDDSVFENMSLNAQGVMTYTIKSGANTGAGSYMNIVFEVK